MAMIVLIAPSWLYQVGSPIGRRNELMIGDIHRPQRSTKIMFSDSSISPARVASDRIGAGSLRKYAVMKARLIANSQAATDQLRTPARASANSTPTPPVT